MIHYTKNSPAKVSFAITDAERIMIGQCVSRAMDICKRLKIKVSNHYAMDVKMDLAACHANGNPLDFQKLLAFDDLNFMHDMGGITQHIDRNTGELRHSFSPRATVVNIKHDNQKDADSEAATCEKSAAGRAQP